jgi:hypothetical protein
MIEDGEYGYCQNCSQPIGRARLEALPFATLCIKCREWLDRFDELREQARSRGGVGPEALPGDADSSAETEFSEISRRGEGRSFPEN